MLTSNAGKLGVFAVVVIGLLTLALVVVGPFNASAATVSPQTQDPPPVPKAESEVSYSDLFVQRFAERLGVNQDTLNAAYIGALSDTFNEAVKDGKLIQADADAMAQKMVTAGLKMLAPIANKLEVKSPSPTRDQFNVELKLAVAHAFAQALEMSDQELQDQWANGKSIVDVARQRGLDIEQVKQSALRNLKTELDQAVQSGKLPQPEADKIYEDMEAQMDRLMSGS